MKIALISNMYPSVKDPVFGIFVKNIEELLLKNNIKIIQKAVRQNSSNVFSKLASYFVLYINILKIFFNEKIQLVYIHFPLQTSPIILFGLKFRNKKIVLNIHGSELNPSSFFHSSFVKLLSKADLIVVPSKTYSLVLQEKYKLKTNKIYVSPSGGVDSNVFYKKKDVDFRKKLGLFSQDIVISYISSFIKEKGWLYFLETVKSLKADYGNLQFLMLGGGPDEALVLNYIKENGLQKNVILVSKQNQTSLAQYFNVSEVLIFPSYKESLGLVALEALSCGVPVIASDIDTLKEYIKPDYNGFLFEARNAVDLETKIRIYLQSEKKELMKLNALQSAADYQSEIVGKRLSEKLEQV